MTDYKYRVYDGETGYEFADVARLQTALLMLDSLRDNYPQVTIDEIVAEPVEADTTPKIGDRVRGIGSSLGGAVGSEGELTYIVDDPTDDFPYEVNTADDGPRWYAKVERV